MALTLVQQHTGNSATANSTPTTAFGAAPTNGNTLVAVVAFGSSTSGAVLNSISETGVTWTRVAQSAQNATGTNRMEIWAGSVGAGASGTVNFTFSATVKYATNLSEWSGGLTTSVAVTAQTNTGVTPSGAATTTSTALANVPAGSLIIGGLCLALSSSITDFTSTSGSPDAPSTPALTAKASGQTSAQNVDVQPLYDLNTSQVSETFSWSTAAAWQYAYAVVALSGGTHSTQALSSSLTGTVSVAKKTTKALFSQFFALDRSAWTCSASDSQVFDPPANALDGSLSTRWSSGIGQYNGLWFKINMGSTQTVSALYLSSTIFGSGDWPRGYSVTTSADDITYGSAIATGSGSTDNTWITFPSTSARYFKVTQTSTSGNWWSIDEVYAFTGTGAVARAVALARSSFAPALTGTAAVARGFGFARTSFAPALTATSTRTQQIIHTASASITAVASVSRTIAHALAATLTQTVTRTQQIRHGLAASCSATVTMARDTASTLTASLAGVGQLVRETASTLTANLAAVGEIAREVATAIAATLAGVGDLARDMATPLASTLTGVGEIARDTASTIAATLAGAGDLAGSLASGVIAYTQTLAASLALAPSITRATSTARAAVLEPAAVLTKAAHKAMSASLRAVGSRSRAVSHGLTAALSAAPTLRKTIPLLLAPAALAASGTLRRTPAVLLQATVTLLADRLPRSIVHGTAVTLHARTRLVRGLVRGFDAQLGVQGQVVGLIAQIRLALYSARALVNRLPRRVVRAVMRRTQAAVAERRARALVARLQEDGTMLAQPIRSDEALYLSPHEVAVSFTLDLAHGVPEGTDITSAEILSVAAKWPGQPDAQAMLLTGFAAIGTISGAVITLIAGDGRADLLGMDVEVTIAVTYPQLSGPATVALFVPLPIRRGAPG